jgi:hypothetical protein
VSQSAAQAAAFRRELASAGEVWTIEDAGGVPAPKAQSGPRAMPFWSTQSRAQRVIETAPAYAGFAPRRLTLEEFEARWLPGLQRDGLLVGINWSGPRATGYELEPETVAAWLRAARES